MPTVTAVEPEQHARFLPAPRARIGMIIPSVNSMTEPQFNRFAPPGLGVHVARARVAGEWKRPLAAMAEEIAAAAKLLADVAPDLIVFHCTDTSMTQGPQGEGRILDIVQDATGIEAVATSRLVLEALQALGLRSLLLLSPYKLYQYDPGRGDRGYRARARQARRQQQPGGAMGLRQAAQIGACSFACDAAPRPFDAAHGCVTSDQQRPKP